MLITPPCPTELRDLLFDEDAAHAHHRRTITNPLFRHRPEATTEERWRLAYERLRHLNAELPVTAERLANDPRRLAALHEWTSIVDGATATVAGIHYNLFLGSVLDDQDSPPRDLTPYTALTRTGTFLCTEEAHGNDAPALETTATYEKDADEFVLHTPHAGAAKFMPNTSPAGGPKTAVVAARLLTNGADEGVFLFLTPLTDETGPLPGITISALPERIGSPVDHCVTTFTHVRLPRTALIQGPHGRLERDGTVKSLLGSPRKRFLTAIDRVTTGKLCMSASTLGGARAALAVAVRYSERRTVSAPTGGAARVPLSAYTSHHSRLLSRVATAYAMTFLHRAVMDQWLSHSPTDPAERAAAERLVAIAKGWITYQARDIVTECRERCGARALFPVNGLADYPANVEGAITAEGDNLAVWSKAGAEMLFAHPLAEEQPKATGAESVTDVTFLHSALTTAERHWHQTARTALRTTASKSGAFTRWNNAALPALTLVETHALRQASTAFTTARTHTTSPHLTALHTLFLLRHLQPHEGLLAAEGALTPTQLHALPTARTTLTTTLAPHLPTLTAAFDIPDEHLNSLPMLTP